MKRNFTAGSTIAFAIAFFGIALFTLIGTDQKILGVCFAVLAVVALVQGVRLHRRQSRRD